MKDTMQFHVPVGSSVHAAWRKGTPPSQGAAAGEVPPPPAVVEAPPPLQAFPGELQPPAVAPPPEEARAIEAAAMALAQGPGVAAVRSNRQYIVRMAHRWATKNQIAEAAGVQLRKATFFNKLLSTGGALITLGVAAALAVATGGAALPFVLIASVRAAVLVSDSMCAWADWRGAKETPPVRMPLGANSLGNLIYALGTRWGLPEAQAKSLGKNVSAVLIVGLGAAGLALSMPHEGIAPAGAALRYAASALGLAGTSRQAGVSDQEDPILQDRDAARADLHTALLEQAIQPGMNLAGFAAWCATLRTDLASAGMDAQTQADLQKVIAAVAEDVRAGESVTDPVGTDRANIVPRLVNDLQALNAGTNLVWTAVAQGRLLGVIGAL